VGKQLKLADARGARVAVVVGPDDRARGEVMVRDLAGKVQASVARGQAVDRVAELLRTKLSP
jgi:histidyl-tRNA synthetase